MKRPGDLIESSELGSSIVGKMLGRNALNWLGIRDKTRALLMNAPHRAKNHDINLKRELAGTYMQNSDISLSLREDGTFECVSSERAFRIEGQWKIGTYVRSSSHR